VNDLSGIPVRVADPWPVTDPEAAREWALEEYHEWVREGIRGTSEMDWNPREDVDFDEFLTARAQPHMVDADRYAAAMEDPFDRALSLVDLARGNRVFNRSMGGGRG
jgi:hypothetical protein